MNQMLGTLTIGQAPRSDITPILQQHLPAHVRCLHAGVLDGLSVAEVAEQFAPLQGGAVLTTRMLDGKSVILDKSKVRQALQKKLTWLEAQGCGVILLLCTGEFEGLACRDAWLIEPDHVVPPVVAALTGVRQIAVIVPLAEQVQSEAGKWHPLAKQPLYGIASPYAEGPGALVHAAQDMKAQGADLLVLDCMGFTERHRELAAEASGLPVLLSNALMARLLAEVV